MERWLLALALTLATTGNALALPGQSEKQLAAWGKSNSALAGFKKTFDQNTAGNNYQATLNVDGHAASFSAEPVAGVVPHEYVAFEGLPDTWQASAHLSLVRDALTLVYGKAVADDFQTAGRVKASIPIWKGKRYAYATADAAIVLMRLSDLKQALKNARDCGALDCAGD